MLSDRLGSKGAISAIMSPLLGMTRVLRGDKRTLAVPVDQLPVLTGLQVVMMRAESIEEVEGSEVGIGPVRPVVGL
jgi:hypothetical protein